MKPSPSRHAPRALREQFKTAKLRYSLNSTLYDISEESDRAIRAGHLRHSDALSALINWAIARLVVCDTFDGRHWQTLGNLTRPENDSLELRKFIGTAIYGAVGGNPSWRADDRHKHKLLARADTLAEELLSIIEDSRELDIRLAELTTVEPQLKPLVDRSEELHKQAFAQSMERSRALRRDATLSAEERMTASVKQMGADYFQPTLMLFLHALRERLAGRLPRPPNTSKAFYRLSRGEQELLQKHFGIKAEKQQMPSIDLDTGGEFGAYPKQRKALRRAVVQALCEQVCSPWRDHTAGHRFSAAKFIEALCIAWFGDAPTTKQMDAILAPLRKQQKALAVNAHEWEAADGDSP